MLRDGTQPNHITFAELDFRRNQFAEHVHSVIAQEALHRGWPEAFADDVHLHDRAIVRQLIKDAPDEEFEKVRFIWVLRPHGSHIVSLWPTSPTTMATEASPGGRARYLGVLEEHALYYDCYQDLALRRRRLEGIGKGKALELCRHYDATEIKARELMTK
jgi:hypothetical protein